MLGAKLTGNTLSVWVPGQARGTSALSLVALRIALSIGTQAWVVQLAGVYTVAVVAGLPIKTVAVGGATILCWSSYF